MSTVEASSAQFSILRRPLENGATLEGSLCQLCQFSNFVQFVFFTFLRLLPILKRKIEFFAPFFANLDQFFEFFTNFST